MTDTKDTATKDASKKAYDREREHADKVRAEGQERLSKGKPTPTQDENDRTKLGEHIIEHEDDGSGPDPHARKPENHKTRNMEAGQRPSYSIRSG